MQPVKAITLKICAVVLFIVMSSLLKVVVEEVPTGEAVFFRSVCAMGVTVVWLMIVGELRQGLRIVWLGGHLWRGVAGTLAMALKIAALAFLPLPEVTALGYTTSLLIVVFAAVFLGERVGIFRSSAVIVGFCGVLIIVAPKLTLLSGAPMEAREVLGVAVILIGATFAAVAQVTIRRLVQTDHAAAIAFYFAVTSTVLSLLSAPFGWVRPDGTLTLLLVLAGLLGGIAQIFLTTSYRYADASVVAPFDYASMLFALAIGYFVFDEVPTGPMLIGAALIAAAGIAIILREHRLGLKRSQTRALRAPPG